MIFLSLDLILVKLPIFSGYFIEQLFLDSREKADLSLKSI